MMGGKGDRETGRLKDQEIMGIKGNNTEN